MPFAQNSCRAALILLLSAGLGWLPVAWAAQDDGGERVINTQTRIQTTEEGVEIELTSSRPFPVRALPPVLRIGERDFWRSRNPDDGRLETLIFLVPAEDFEALETATPLSGFFALGRDGTTAVPEPGGDVWDFGPLQRDLLDRPKEEPER